MIKKIWLLSVLLSFALFFCSSGSAASRSSETADKSVPASEAGASSGKDDSSASISGRGGGDDEKAASEDRPKSTTTTSKSSSGLKAGFADDNKQFNYFINFLAQYQSMVEFFALPVSERIVLHVRDLDGKSLPNALVHLGKQVYKTYADGSFSLYPLLLKGDAYPLTIEFAAVQTKLTVDRYGPRQIDVDINTQRPIYSKVPLDILFILDTTGSMSEEIERLKATIEIINLNLISLSSQPQLRFGMVLYKDMLDEYDTKVIPLTADLDQFQKELNKVRAGGGGDRPEDLQSALADSMQKIAWNDKAIRLAFIITDAPPHLSTYEQTYTYVSAALEARERAIKIFSIGTGGLDLQGEYILRQISQFTQARYIFLTYGESEESAGGAPGSVSHHTGTNFQTDKLETIIIRIAKEELSYLTNQPLEEGEDYFDAVKLQDEDKDKTLNTLFGLLLQQLVDYATLTIAAKTPCAILPIQFAVEDLKLNAEYFSDHLIGALAENKTFTAVERQDLQKLLDELEFQISDLTDPQGAARIGKLMGAQMLIYGTLYRKEDCYELFVKLVRVETGEILSVAKAKIDFKLGL